MDDLDKMIQEQMKDPVFREEWQKSQLEYDITELLISSRKDQNLTQNELSERAGIRQSNLSRIEKGQVLPSLGTLEKIAHGLGKQLKVSFV